MKPDNSPAMDSNGTLRPENLGKRIQIRALRLRQGNPAEIIEDSTRIIGGILEAYELRKNDIVVSIRGLGQYSFPRLVDQIFVTLYPEPPAQ